MSSVNGMSLGHTTYLIYSIIYEVAKRSFILNSLLILPLLRFNLNILLQPLQLFLYRFILSHHSPLIFLNHSQLIRLYFMTMLEIRYFKIHKRSFLYSHLIFFILGFKWTWFISSDLWKSWRLENWETEFITEFGIFS